MNQYTKEDIEGALRTAAVYIRKLPEKIPYFLSAMDDEGVSLDITLQTQNQFWYVAAILERQPIGTTETMYRKAGALVIEAYMEKWK
jgi:hypothetical protein